MASMSLGWNDYAVLTPSKGGKPWKVQINGEGRFRCSCPAFIFCKGVKTCKHCRRCEEQRAAEGVGQAVVAKPVQPAWMTDAAALTDAMLRAAQTFVTDTQRTRMVEVLGARLRSYVPPSETHAGAVAVQATVVIGVRRITFDD